MGPRTLFDEILYRTLHLVPLNLERSGHGAPAVRILCEPQPLSRQRGHFQGMLGP